MLCPKRVLLFSALLTVLLDPISGQRRGYVSSQGNYEDTPYAGGHGIISYDRNYRNKYLYNPPKSLLYYRNPDRELVKFPVYHGPLPDYVFRFKDSGSKYGSLLTGLALFNLGALGASAHSHIRNSRRNPPPSEVCQFEVKLDNGTYEKAIIDCQIISSFISQNPSKNVTRSVIKKPTRRRKPIMVEYEMLGNGSLVTVKPIRVVVDAPVEVTTASRHIVGGGSVNDIKKDAEISSEVTIDQTTDNNNINETLENTLDETGNDLKNKTIKTLKSALDGNEKDNKTETNLRNALDVKGMDLIVTPGMQCFVSRTSPAGSMRKSVPCDLLQAYSDRSIKTLKSSAHNARTLGLIATIVVIPFFGAF